MDKDNIKQSIKKRLNRIQGQIRGIKRMVEGNQQCGNVLVQIAAVKAAINKVGGIILENYAKSCMENTAEDHKNSNSIDDLIATILKFMKGNEALPENDYPIKDVVVGRLENIELKIQKIQEMINTNDRCSSILANIAEVRGEIIIVGQMILENYTRTCIMGAAANNEQENSINNLIDTVLKFIK